MNVAVLIAAALALPAARGAAQPRMPTHVACVGDSITAGYMASSSAAAYPSVLQNMFGASVQVRNFGHSGATMLSTGDLPYQTQTEYTAATTFVAGAGANAVVDVILMLGTNDSKSYNWMSGTATRAQQFVTDCTAMVDHFASLSTHPVVYLALPPRAFGNSYGISGMIIHDQILPLVRQVATARGLPVIDVDTPTASRQDLFPDGVHPNDTGYALVAQVMHGGLLRVPQVTLTRPTAGVVAGPAVMLAADASGGTVAISGVEFFRAMAAGQPTSIARVTASPFTTTWSGAAPGTYQLTAKATDSTGAAATSAAVTVMVTGSDGGADAPGDASGSGGATGSGGRGSGGSGAGGTGAGGSGAGGAGTGGSGSGTGGAGVGGAAAVGTGGSATADAASDSSARADAGTNPPGASGCACQLPAGHRGERGGAGLLLAAIALVWLRGGRCRRPPTRD